MVIACIALSRDGQAVSFDKSKVTDEEISLVARRIHEEAAGIGEFKGAPRPKDKVHGSQVRKLLAAQVKDKDSDLYGAFAEVKPRGAKHIDFARGYFDPIATLARAYVLEGGDYYHSPELMEGMHRALIYTRKYVYPKCDKPGNWWVWAKQMPDCQCRILALVSNHLSAEDREYIVSVLDYLVGKGAIDGTGYHHGKAGKDALNVLKVSVLTGDRDRIAHAWECMENEVSPYLLEPDGTPLMTLIKPVNLGISLPYVYEGYRTVIDWARLTRGTSMALREETTGKITRYLLELGRWNTFRGTEVAWIGFTCYRVFWSQAITLTLARQLAEAQVVRADELKLMAAGEDRPPIGCRFWPSAETVIFRTPAFYCALVMASQAKHRVSSTYKNHCLNIGNRWYYGRDGHLILIRRPEDMDENLTYTLDWKRLTGVTSDDGSLFDSDQMVKHDHGYFVPSYVLCRNRMAGASILDSYDAVAGLEVRTGQIQARKSYFFLYGQSMIVALGSHIRGRGTTESIVHTFPIESASTQLVVDGERLSLTEGHSAIVATPAWIFGPGGGYYLPDAGHVTLLTEARKADFSDHGGPNPEREAAVGAQRFVSIFFDHGRNPQGTTYACVYFPLSTIEDMPRHADDFKSKAVYGRQESGHFFTYESFTGAAFYRHGRLAGFSADGPCFLAARHKLERLRLSLYEPSWTDCKLGLSLYGTEVVGTVPKGCQLDGRKISVPMTAGVPRAFNLAVQTK
ncbi:MAG: polysaccharide lyase family 8 super-sandwich domain-containing protein [Planctomycetota bacterium]|jgi:hypothetical protein